jgi:hypothetical protein
VVMAGKHAAVVAAGWIADEYAVMMLPGCWWFVTLFASIRDWIKVSIDRLDWQSDTSIRIMHLPFAVLADGHSLYSPQRLKPRCCFGANATAEAAAYRSCCS